MNRRFGRHSAWRVGATLRVLLLLAISGCSKSSSATVSGHVHYKGDPVTIGSVTFYGTDNQTATAPIKADGSYTATEVPLGTVKVAVITPRQMSAAMAKGLQKLKKGQFTPPTTKTVAVPPQYSKPEQSGLELTVRSGKQPFEIDLK